MKYFLIPAAAVCAALFAGCASQPSEEKALDFPAPSVTLTIQESGDAFRSGSASMRRSR